VCAGILMYISYDGEVAMKNEYFRTRVSEGNMP
jgi:hypothetical protein